MNTSERSNRAFTQTWTAAQRAAIYAEATHRAHAARREAMAQFWQSLGDAVTQGRAWLSRKRPPALRGLCL